MVSNSAARAKSIDMSNGRLRERSICPAANTATTTPGAIAIALKIDTETADALSVVIAMMGNAVRVTRLPTALTACAAQSLRKSE